MNPYEAYAEGGDHVTDPDHATLVRLIGALNTSDNTFFVVQPDDDDLAWSASVATRRTGLGGYDVGWHDTRTGEQHDTVAADPTTIATDLLAWITTR